MKATRPPSVSSPRLVAMPPSSSSTPITTLGIRSRKAQNEPRRRALLTWVWYTTRACAVCRPAASPRRPRALSTRMPAAASST
jgi:hypothetical protein